MTRHTISLTLFTFSKDTGSGGLFPDLGIEKDSRRNGQVEALDLPLHRKPDFPVGEICDRAGHSLFLPSDDKNHGMGEGSAGERFSVKGQNRYPVPLFFQEPEAVGKVPDTNQGKSEHGPGRSLGCRLGERGHPPFRKKDPPDAGGIAGPEKGSKISRILDPVHRDKRARWPGVALVKKCL